MVLRVYQNFHDFDKYICYLFTAVSLSKLLSQTVDYNLQGYEVTIIIMTKNAKKYAIIIHIPFEALYGIPKPTSPPSFSSQPHK